MASARLDPIRTVFACDGYEIYDRLLATKGEVVIFSPGWLVPKRGDTFTIESDRRVHDVEVREVVRFECGGSSARCKVVGWVC